MGPPARTHRVRSAGHLPGSSVSERLRQFGERLAQRAAAHLNIRSDNFEQYALIEKLASPPHNVFDSGPSGTTAAGPRDKALEGKLEQVLGELADHVWSPAA